MNPDNRGKVALVTGASKGIGQAIAERLAADGAAVVVHYGADEAGADETVRRIAAAGGKAKALRAEVGDAVAPGPVDTALFRKGKTEAQLQMSAGFSPLNRVGTPQEVAGVVAFLASAEASWMTGQVVRANGGWI